MLRIITASTLTFDPSFKHWQVMRAKFVKLRSFLEAHPKVFAVHDSTGNSSTSSSSLLGDDKAEQYGIALASSSVISAVDILAMMMPQIQTELPSRVETVHDRLRIFLVDLPNTTPLRFFLFLLILERKVCLFNLPLSSAFDL